jgi:hypothetical protein
MEIRNPLAGRGTRRKSDEQWDKLVEALSTAQRDLATANQQIATLTRQRDEARGNDIRHHNLWQAAHREVLRLRFLLGEDAKLPATQVPAPVDNGIRDTPLANAETQPVDVRELREAVGEGDTQTLPVVSPVSPVLPLHDAPLPPVTWGRTRDTDTAAIEANLGTPAPTPEFAATAVPPGIPDLAHDKVHAALGEAS